MAELVERALEYRSEHPGPSGWCVSALRSQETGYQGRRITSGEQFRRG